MVVPAVSQVPLLFWICHRLSPWLLLLCVWISGAGTPAAAQQTRRSPDYLHLAEPYWENNQFFEAARYYQEALRQSPGNMAAHYRLAECYRQLFDYAAAESHYGKVYYAGEADFPLALFYYALMQKYTGKHTEALRNFEKFSRETESSEFPEKPVFRLRTRIEMDGCRLALRQHVLPQRSFTFSRPAAPVNSPYNDYSPVRYEHDSSLVLTSGRPLAKGRQKDTRYGEFFSDLYRLEKTAAGWVPVARTDQFESINSHLSDGTGAFNRTGDKFYFTSCAEKDASCKIYLTELKNGRWTRAVKLNEHINAAGSNSRQASLSPGGDTLFFVSDRPGGYGMNDIWLSVSAGRENWGPPVNAGKTINTPLNDLSPYFDAQENVLFFASDGHPGWGGLDIFLAAGGVFQESTVTNIGPPFNSSMDDAFFISGRDIGYLASNRPGGEGQFDIYSFQTTSQELILAYIRSAALPGKPGLEYLQEFSLEYLPEEDKLLIDRMIGRKVAGKIYGTDVPLLPEESHLYERLTPQEKEQLDRLVRTRLDSLTEEEQRIIRTQDRFAYEHLPPEEREQLDRIVRAYQRHREPADAILKDTTGMFFYEQLDYQAKKQADRMVIARAAQASANADGAPAPEPEDRMYYEKLPALDKERIDRMAVSRRMAPGQPLSDAPLHEDDARYYASLPPEEQRRLDRLTAFRAVTAEKQTDTLALLAGETFGYESLPTADQAQISRRTERSLLRKTLPADETGVLPADSYPVDPGQYRDITLTGVLRRTDTYLPASGVAVTLLNGKGEVVQTTRSGEDGIFRYENLPLSESYRIQLGTAPSRISQRPEYYADNLQMIGYAAETITETLESIYFDFNTYNLRAEARLVLDKLADYCTRKPHVQIELNAYTDSLGSVRYNRILSQKRGEAAVDYLRGRGVPASALILNARGAINPVASNADETGRQLNRRVEFSPKNVQVSRQLYPAVVMSAQTDVRKIAAEYGIPVETLRAINGLTGDTVAPYSPLRVRLP